MAVEGGTWSPTWPARIFLGVGLWFSLAVTPATPLLAPSRCTMTVLAADGAGATGATGATNGLERRSLSSPTHVVRPPPDGYCEEVYAHVVPNPSLRQGVPAREVTGFRASGRLRAGQNELNLQK